MVLLSVVQVWCLGNIEEVAVARGNVDQSRAVGADSASYLLGLDKDYQPGNSCTTWWMYAHCIFCIVCTATNSIRSIHQSGSCTEHVKRFV